ncbi:MAG: hypothetical protein ACOYW7_11290 [Nitrospirota bacterium]
MNIKTILLVFLLLLAVPFAAQAELDFGQEVLVIPDTHNEKPYIWQVQVNPKEYELLLENAQPLAGEPTTFGLLINSKSGESIRDLHVFITDEELHTYKHIKPVFDNGRYKFTYTAPWAGTYRIEVVFPTGKGWVNLRKDIKVKGRRADHDAAGHEDDKGYSVNVKLIPRKIYAEHVVTFLYELSYNGTPIKGLEKIGGADMQVAAWDEDLKEFIYATPKQNLGGPEVAVSFVFMQPGKHAIFAEFKHNGVIRKIDLVVNVYEEPKHDSSEGSGIRDLRPSDG